ncbi:hypothetical protein KBY55_18715 [Streptomyces sp. b94]|uniref:hypothetical protein n=1 Tax=Streptomyces sp. b94 TaxID=1827634 RepID=UPI001B366F2B|nr:hypothetical protein [Streptomyces sp. b94]MBQ1098061.1 hypothetical protein [Streptomyces sp. b94]
MQRPAASPITERTTEVGVSDAGYGEAGSELDRLLKLPPAGGALEEDEFSG